ncbi:hypothetical protein BDA99DRAFT_510602 [Phascolomyces articulosus]|uniref:Uncharacterized protein n=1 Tax=Phascolomyces articulosus TaxID=60185 RepID=A0AAD5JZK7_9FUNG|nr:hypothetical protein BDA99DRAFT_510602 [Phascolomyces articulosus]
MLALFMTSITTNNSLSLPTSLPTTLLLLVIYHHYNDNNCLKCRTLILLLHIGVNSTIVESIGKIFIVKE